MHSVLIYSLTVRKELKKGESYIGVKDRESWREEATATGVRLIVGQAVRTARVWIPDPGGGARPGQRPGVRRGRAL